MTFNFNINRNCNNTNNIDTFIEQSSFGSYYNPFGDPFNPFANFTPPPPPTYFNPDVETNINEPTEYEIQKVLDNKMNWETNKMDYLVQWKHYTENEWINDTTNCEDLILEYWQKKFMDECRKNLPLKRRRQRKPKKIKIKISIKQLKNLKKGSKIKM